MPARGFERDRGRVAPPATVWSWSGFYIGAGGSFNWSRFDQALQAISGIQNITIGPDLVAQAQEGGPFFDFNRNKSGFAPDVQLGYMVPFASGDWQAGLKFNYKYANIDSKENVSIPQAGTLTTVVGTTENITGFVQISPAEINLRHQLALPATIGRAFDKLAIYAGGGPALFGVETKFINGVAFAVIRRQVVSPSGAPLTFLNDNWVWGGAVQVGATYALAPRWFLDFAYTMHLCWGNYEGPHHCDVPLSDIIDVVFTARPAAISFEAANPRHAHEWELFERVKLPAGKILIPGVIESKSNFIEHPELIAQRIGRYAKLVGRENVIAGSDCGFGTWVGQAAVDPDVVWAKLAAMVEGARIASKKFWS